MTAGFQGTLGFGFPTALGVKVACPSKEVISITGDGGFLFAAQELATAVQYGINLVTVVFNNDAFGNVLRDQKETFGGRFLGSKLVNPDFVKFGESFGVPSFRAESPQALRRILDKAFGLNSPCSSRFRSHAAVKVAHGSSFIPNFHESLETGVVPRHCASVGRRESRVRND